MDESSVGVFSDVEPTFDASMMGEDIDDTTGSLLTVMVGKGSSTVGVGDLVASTGTNGVSDRPDTMGAVVAGAGAEMRASGDGSGARSGTSVTPGWSNAPP